MDPSLTSNELRRQPPPKAHTKKMKHIIQRPAISRFSSSWIPSLSRRRSTQPHNERNSQPPQHSAANVVAIAQHSVAESIVSRPCVVTSTPPVIPHKNLAELPNGLQPCTNSSIQTPRYNVADLSTLSTATSNSDDQTYEKSILRLSFDINADIHVPSSILHDVNADDLRQTVQRRLSEHISLLLQERTLDAFSSWTAAYPDHVLADERRYTYGETQDEQTPGDKGRSTSMDEDRFPPTPTSYSAPCHFSVATALQDAHLPPTPTSYSPPPHDDAMAIASLSELAGQLTASQYQEWHVQDGSSTSDPPPDTARDEDMALVGPESPEPSSSGGLNQALRSRSTASLPSISPSLSSSPPSSSASPYVRFPSKSSELTQPDGQASVRVGTHKQYRPGLSDLRLIPWTGTSLSIPLVDGGPILPQYHTQSLEKPINEVATVSNSALSGEAASLAPWTGVVSESSAYSIPESQFLPTAPEVADARPRNQVWLTVRLSDDPDSLEFREMLWEVNPNNANTLVTSLRLDGYIYWEENGIMTLIAPDRKIPWKFLAPYHTRGVPICLYRRPMSRFDLALQRSLGVLLYFFGIVFLFWQPWHENFWASTCAVLSNVLPMLGQWVLRLQKRSGERSMDPYLNSLHQLDPWKFFNMLANAPAK